MAIVREHYPVNNSPGMREAGSGGVEMSESKGEGILCV